jgi:signal transduction histidine kinase
MDGTETSFRALARSIILMGSELVTDAVVAVMELVKNGYDAHATEVKIKIETSEGLTIVRDNGFGMTKPQIEKDWMAIGGSMKAAASGQPKMTTHGERAVQGEKGIGRLSAQRLGRRLRLVTRARRKDGSLEPKECYLDINWDDFLTTSKQIHEIPIVVHEREPQVYLKSSGTLLRLVDPVEPWSAPQLSALKNTIGKFFDPFLPIEQQGMRVSLQIDGGSVNPYEALQNIISRYTYSVEGTVDNEFRFTGVVKSPTGEKEYRDHPLQPRLTRAAPRKSSVLPDHQFKPCGPFAVRIYAFERKGRGENLVALLDYLDNVARGVMVYRDGVRLMPYGNLGDDWLELDRASSGKVGDYFSNRQLLGAVAISHEDNPHLRDKTNREGLMETEAFRTFRGLLWNIVDLLNDERKRHRAKRSQREDVVDIQAELKQLSSDPNVRPVVRERIEAIALSFSSHVRNLKKREVTMMELSGIGLAAERTTHEFAKLVKRLRRVLSTELDDDVSERTRSSIRSSLAYLDQIEGELWNLEPLYFSSRSSMEEVLVSSAVNSVREFFVPDLDESGATLDVVVEEPLTVHESRGLIVQALFNLVDNALYWAVVHRKKKGHVQIRVQGRRGRLLVVDNGAGVDEEDQNLIFEPLFGHKPGGRGLGLYIVPARALWRRNGGDLGTETIRAGGCPPAQVFCSCHENRESGCWCVL